MASLLDEFYPISTSARTSAMWEIGMLMKINSHLQSARNGNREAESKLINRLGQLRRSVDSFNNLGDNLQEAVKESVEWLRSIGRVVDFKNQNPGLWITARDGKTARF